jgi:hypothetical protein
VFVCAANGTKDLRQFSFNTLFKLKIILPDAKWYSLLDNPNRIIIEVGPMVVVAKTVELAVLRDGEAEYQLWLFVDMLAIQRLVEMVLYKRSN